MRRIRVDDPFGGRWTVRARYDRHAPVEGEFTQRRREPELWARLPGVLSPQPGLGGVPADDETWDPAARPHRPVLAGGGVIGLLLAIGQCLRVLREPTASTWVVELEARGRFRRGATWRVLGPAAAETVAAAVAEAVRLGQVPQPSGALLVDAVDQRLTVYGAPR